MLRQFPYERVQGLLNKTTGLDMAEADRRREKYGDNNILEASDNSGWRELLNDTIRDPMLWFLLVTASLFAAIGDVKEAVILALAIIPLAGMDWFLHRRSRASTASLGGRLAAYAEVIRDGQQLLIASRDIVCGDLVILKPNMFLPADGIIVAAQEAQIDESALTGEAFPVAKKAYGWKAAQGSPGDMVPLEMEHWGFAGTRLLTGEAQMRVVYTGHETYYGEIVRSALAGRHARTPLQIAITNLVKVLLGAAAVMCLLLAAVRLYQGFGLMDAFISAITLAVAALPEEFPIVFTFFLGVGVYRLAKQKALVRRAVAVENIGRITTVCSDKTGTLTFGRLTLADTYPAPSHSSAQLLEKARLASRAESGDPLDLAIISATSGTDANPVNYLATYPFTENRKKETVVLATEQGQSLAIVKGAPETVFAQCNLSSQMHVDLEHSVNRLAENGHKLIACAQRLLSVAEEAGPEPQTDFEYLGLLAFEDPTRDGVAEAIRFCRNSGIHVIMITGDHPLTARAVAKKIGLGDGEPRIMLAEEIENSGSNGARSLLHQVDVIARSVPAQKLRFVQQLQAEGEIVAVTGDGVNDVPALQAADVGIAMGERGTQAAREVSAILLLDDNFRTVVNAIAEGKQLFNNLRMSFIYLLLMHLALIISAAVIPFMGFPLLYLPIHIVWLELIIHPSALLAYQQFPKPELSGRSSTVEKNGFFSPYEWLMILLIGMLFTGVVAAGYIYSLSDLRNVEHARAMALAVLCLGSAFVTAALSKLATAAARLVVSGTALSVLLMIQVPLFADMMHLQPLHLLDWLLALIASGAVAALVLVLTSGFGRRRSTTGG